MFQFEPVNSSIVDRCEGVDKFINILPLDDIPVGLPKNWKFKPTCMPDLYAQHAESLANFKVREDDVWIVTYAKCGTTWTQEMTWLLMNDMNFDMAKSEDITKRSIFFEFNGVIGLDSWDALKEMEKQKSPRVIKSHLPIGLLPRDIWRKKCKVIYVARDPKDAAVSFFHHFVGMHKFSGSINEFAEAFIANQLSYCSYWSHVLEFWMIRQVENVLFITYEDMKKDLKVIIDRTCAFVGRGYDEKDVCRLVDHLSFDKMKENPMTNNQGLVRFLCDSINEEYNERKAFKFMRKGKVGSYKNELSLDCIDKMNAKTKEIFCPYGLYLYCKDD